MLIIDEVKFGCLFQLSVLWAHQNKGVDNVAFAFLLDLSVEEIFILGDVFGMLCAIESDNLSFNFFGGLRNGLNFFSEELLDILYHNLGVVAVLVWILDHRDIFLDFPVKLPEVLVYLLLFPQNIVDTFNFALDIPLFVQELFLGHAFATQVVDDISILEELCELDRKSVV